VTSKTSQSPLKTAHTTAFQLLADVIFLFVLQLILTGRVQH